MITYEYINWGPFVMKSKVSMDIVDGLLQAGKKKLENFNKGLAGQLEKQFKYDSLTQTWFWNKFQPYIQSYRNGHCKFHGMPKLNVEYTPQELWVNYMESGDYNPPHIHNEDLSFVLFLDVPDELKEEQKKFEGTYAKPGSLMLNFTQNSRPAWATTETYILPNTGDLIIFPALLTHSVCPFK